MEQVPGGIQEAEKGPADKALISLPGDDKVKANEGSKHTASLQESGMSARGGPRKYGTGDRASQELTVCHLPSLSRAG